ncbi:hypothetical protein EBS02_03875 [bacterium]|nr:hypothetical protein [bacterium]
MTRQDNSLLKEVTLLEEEAKLLLEFDYYVGAGLALGGLALYNFMKSKNPKTNSDGSPRADSSVLEDIKSLGIRGYIKTLPERTQDWAKGLVNAKSSIMLEKFYKKNGKDWYKNEKKSDGEFNKNMNEIHAEVNSRHQDLLKQLDSRCDKLWHQVNLNYELSQSRINDLSKKNSSTEG